jgi:hypothetical protein
VDGRACGDDWLTFAELAAGGALAYRTGTTPGTGWGGGTGRGAAGVLRRVMRASPGPSA